MTPADDLWNLKKIFIYLIHQNSLSYENKSVCIRTSSPIFREVGNWNVLNDDSSPLPRANITVSDSRSGEPLLAATLKYSAAARSRTGPTQL